MAQESTEEEIVENVTRRRAVQEKMRGEAQVKANAAKAIKAQYKKIADEPAIVDLLAKIKSFQAYHMKIAQDGVAYKFKEAVADNKIVQLKEEVKLTDGERTAQLERNAGIQEILDYIDRQLA
jgi:hypothetical protein